MHKPGVAVIGAGEHARRNTLPALARADGSRLVGLFGRNGATAQEQAQRYGCKSYGDAGEALDDPEVAIVYVALPVGLHADAAHAALRAGKHVWCEKSLASSA